MSSPRCRWCWLGVTWVGSFPYWLGVTWEVRSPGWLGVTWVMSSPGWSWCWIGMTLEMSSSRCWLGVTWVGSFPSWLGLVMFSCGWCWLVSVCGWSRDVWVEGREDSGRRRSWSAEWNWRGRGSPMVVILFSGGNGDWRWNCWSGKIDGSVYSGFWDDQVWGWEATSSSWYWMSWSSGVRVVGSGKWEVVLGSDLSWWGVWVSSSGIRIDGSGTCVVCPGVIVLGSDLSRFCCWQELVELGNGFWLRSGKVVLILAGSQI